MRELNSSLPFDPSRLYRANDPALRILAAESTLAQWRHKGVGPPFIKFGARVLYRGIDLNRCVEERLVRTESPSPKES